MRILSSPLVRLGLLGLLGCLVAGGTALAQGRAPRGRPAMVPMVKPPMNFGARPGMPGGLKPIGAFHGQPGKPFAGAGKCQPGNKPNGVGAAKGSVPKPAEDK